MKTFLLSICFLIFKQSFAQDTTVWNKKTAADWFKKEVWLHAGASAKPKYDEFGRVLEEASGSDSGKKANPLKPHSSIDRVVFAREYNKNKEAWDKAFAYLRETDLGALPVGKFSVGDLIVMVTDGHPRRMDTTKWEGHLLYADIQYVFRGRERIGRADISGLTPVTEYDPVRDIRFYDGKGKYFLAEAGVFFIFFPGEGHRPNLQVGEETDKKIVVKVRVAGSL
ncbi:MAG TPA: YhcH/YjgK/YiaL family protein [Puia sp.]